MFGFVCGVGCWFVIGCRYLGRFVCWWLGVCVVVVGCFLVFCGWFLVVVGDVGVVVFGVLFLVFVGG